MSKYLGRELDVLHSAGLYKEERVITSPQSANINTADGNSVLNLCANNYLGLANHPELIESAKAALDRCGYGLASVRFICGTQQEHKTLEKNIADFLGREDAILYSSCFDANTGLFETLVDERDAIISDELNHASIIDGVRLSKAKRYRYKNNNMIDLNTKLQESRDARFRIIATDGVFSMDGTNANLTEICNLADQHNAIVMVDDSHGVGCIGEGGRGTAEVCGVQGRIDILTGTLGKALGGASGGYVASTGTIIEWLRQRSRPYLFSNTLAPVITASSIRALELVDNGGGLRRRLHRNAANFRSGISKLGFQLIDGDHPIIPIMLQDAITAQQMATRLLTEGVYVTAFSFPVVPEGQARIRTQMSAAHSRKDIERAISAFEKVGFDLELL